MELALPEALPRARPLTLADRLDQWVFGAVCSRSLVYNTCWEDPAVDRAALELGPSDRVLVITSAGCNALDYALAGPAEVVAVDANPRQNALLELKLAAIRHLDYEDAFALFGTGRHPRFGRLLESALGHGLSPFARAYWRDRVHWFEQPPGGSFYFQGLSGLFARGIRAAIALRRGLRDAVDALLAARDLTQQQRIYDERIAPALWGPVTNWALSRQATLTLLGVPHPQRREVERQHRHGVAGFMRESIEYVVRHLPMRSNYFWRLYLRGRYEPWCCPEYLTPRGFAALKAGAAARVSVHTATVTELLRAQPRSFSRFVLLDHMDWMSSYFPAALAEEWRFILRRARPGARILFRSAHVRPAYLDELRVRWHGRWNSLQDLCVFHPVLAERLARNDRVHTYAGFHIADLRR